MNHANLLPTAWRRRSLIRQRLRQWCVVWILSAVGITAASATQYWLARRGERVVTELEVQAAPVRERLRQTDQMRSRLEELDSRESLLAALESTREPFLLMGMVAQSAQKLPGRLWLDNFRLESTRRPGLRPVPGTPATSPPTDVEEVKLTLDGNAVDDMAITRFVATLRSYRVFDDVHLDSLVGDRDQGPREFSVSCVYEK